VVRDLRGEVRTYNSDCMLQATEMTVSSYDVYHSLLSLVIDIESIHPGVISRPLRASNASAAGTCP
jgi:hypothetical protein